MALPDANDILPTVLAWPDQAKHPSTRGPESVLSRSCGVSLSVDPGLLLPESARHRAPGMNAKLSERMRLTEQLLWLLTSAR